MNLFNRKVRTICMCNVVVPFVCTGFLGIKANNGLVLGNTTDEAHEISLTASDTEPVSQFREGEENTFAFITESIIAVLNQQDELFLLDEEDDEFAFITSGVKAVINQQEKAITEKKEVKKVENKKTTKSTTTKKTTSKTTSVVTKKEVNKAAYTKPSSTSATGEAIVAYAKRFKGLRYRGGTPSLSSGADCSGFTMLIYREFGISLPRTVSGQKNRGKAVSQSNLQKGDLVFYKPRGCRNCGVSHVAIYIGGGQVIHETRPGRGVAITSLNGLSNIQYVTARRIINSSTIKVTNVEEQKKVETKVETKTDNTSTTTNNELKNSTTNNEKDKIVNSNVVENSNTVDTTKATNTETIKEELQEVKTDVPKVEVVETPKTEVKEETPVVENITTVKEESKKEEVKETEVSNTESN